VIPYGKQSINLKDRLAVFKSLKSDWLTTGPLVREFEESLANTVGSPTVVVSSGTAALHCAYRAIGITSGDEVITPPLTFIATQATAALLGAKVVFADIQKETGNIDPHEVSKAITSKTKAIVAVDFAGHPADLDELKKIASSNNIYLIEDAAHSIGSVYKNKAVGSIADLTTFSFFPTKNMTTGEGGAVASNNENLIEKVKYFARQGLIRDRDKFEISEEGVWHQEVHDFGLNYRLPDILCALGISQLKRLENFKKRRKEIFNQYNDLLQEVNQVEIPPRRSYVDPMWHFYPIRVDAKRRKQIFDSLRKVGIIVQVNYLPVHLQPVFRKKGFKIGDYPVSEEFYSREISLPLHVNLTNREVRFIVNQVKQALSSK
jgi:UDP-4-amino-4,6-dideoxy-N-acetyl-beta-L-altrosamine transaminase